MALSALNRIPLDIWRLILEENLALCTASALPIDDAIDDDRGRLLRERQPWNQQYVVNLMLVSKTWLSAAHPLLFRHLYFYLQHKSLKSFADFLTRTSTGLMPSDPGLLVHSIFFDGDIVNDCGGVIAAVLFRLSNLRSLMSNDEENYIDTLATFLPVVKSSLHTLVMSLRSQSAISLIAEVQGLRELELVLDSSVYQNPPSVPLVLMQSSFPLSHLVKLSIHLSDQNWPLVLHVLSGLSFPSLRQLHLDICWSIVPRKELDHFSSFFKEHPHIMTVRCVIETVEDLKNVLLTFPITSLTISSIRCLLDEGERVPIPPTVRIIELDDLYLDEIIPLGELLRNTPNNFCIEEVRVRIFEEKRFAWCNIEGDIDSLGCLMIAGFHLQKCKPHPIRLTDYWGTSLGDSIRSLP